MSSTTATKSEEPVSNRRRHARIATAVHAPYVSRRGLLHDTYYARCCECGYTRRYQSLGLRICPCGARYQLVAGAVIA